MGYPDAKVIDKNPQELLEYDCDILIPAALERQIHLGNADRIKAKLIGEGIPIYIGSLSIYIYSFILS